MKYRPMTVSDAVFLTRVFSIPEYELYFAENETSVADWEERIPLYKEAQSLIISVGDKDIGWLMYRNEGPVCSIDIIVLLPDERFKGYGKEVLQDLLNQNPQIQIIKLYVQQRNRPAVSFYKKLGFRIVSEEYQPVGNKQELYFNMQFDRKNC